MTRTVCGTMYICGLLLLFGIVGVFVCFISSSLILLLGVTLCAPHNFSDYDILVAPKSDSSICLKSKESANIIISSVLVYAN